LLALVNGVEVVNFDFAWRFSGEAGSAVHCIDSDFKKKSQHDRSAVEYATTPLKELMIVVTLAAKIIRA